MKCHSIIRRLMPALVIAVAMLSGCSWFHRDRTEYYKVAAENRPLEVPPDLDTPSSSKELVVPGASSAAATGSRSSAVSAVPAVDASTDLHVADSVDSTWQRVGLALDRAQVGKVSSRDQSTRSYTLDFNSQLSADTAPAPEHHWYTRVLHPFGGGSDSAKPPVVTVGLRISVTVDAGGARVSVNGNPMDKAAPAAARRVAQILRERLS